MKTILVDAVFTFVDEEGNIFEGLHKLLEQYPNPKIILTNAVYKADNKYKLNDMPYEVFTLEHNPEKTDPKYFKIMLQNLGLAKNDVIYFEHNKEAVKSAEGVGIKSYYYNPAKKDLGALKEFLEENI